MQSIDDVLETFQEQGWEIFSKKKTIMGYPIYEPDAGIGDKEYCVPIINVPALKVILLGGGKIMELTIQYNPLGG